MTGYSPGLLGIQLLRAAQRLWPDEEKFGNFENQKETLETLCKGILPQRAFPIKQLDDGDSYLLLIQLYDSYS